MLTREGMFKPLPPTGARTLDSRTAFYYGYTLDSPGMIMRLPDVGSQYLMGFLDSDGNPVRRRQDLQGDAAEEHPRPRSSGRSRSTTTRRARCSTRRSATRGRQPDLSLARRRGERRRIDDDLLRPDAARRRRPRQLDPDDARQGLVHHPAPVQPARAVLHQGVAAVGDRAGSVSRARR